MFTTSSNKNTSSTTELNCYLILIRIIFFNHETQRSRQSQIMISLATLQIFLLLSKHQTLIAVRKQTKETKRFLKGSTTYTPTRRRCVGVGLFSFQFVCYSRSSIRETYSSVSVNYCAIIGNIFIFPVPCVPKTHVDDLSPDR